MECDSAWSDAQLARDLLHGQPLNQAYKNLLLTPGQERCRLIGWLSRLHLRCSFCGMLPCPSNRLQEFGSRSALTDRGHTPCRVDFTCQVCHCQAGKGFLET